MEAVSTPMVAAAKLLEVILNGDSPPPMRTIDGVEQTYPPTTAEEKLARKNELKARGTLLMALPNEHQLKFNSYKSAKSLMEAIEKRFREIHGETISQEDLNLKLLRSLLSKWKTHTLIWRNKPDLETLSIDDLYNNLKIYEAEVMGSSSTRQNTQNVAFVSSNNTDSTNEAVKTAHGVSAANFKDNASTLPNVDSLSDAEMDLKWQMAMLTMRARRFLKKTGRNLGVNGTDTIGFDKTKLECYNFHRRGHFARECRAPKYQDNRNRETTRRTMPVEETTSNALVSQCDGFGYDWRAYKAGLESVEARLDVYKNNEAIFKEDIKILKLDIMLRDNALTELIKKFEKAKKERDDLKLTLEKFENSSKNLSKLLEIQVSDKFNTVPPPYTGNFMPPKPDLVLADEDEYVFSESVTSVPAVATSEVKTSESKSKSVSEPLKEDWISDSENENETEFKSKKRKPSFAKVEFVKSNEHMKSPREFVRKGNPQQDLKDKGVLDSGCPRHMTRNRSYLSDYEEIDGGFVTFRGSTKGGKITGKGKICTGKLDFKDVYFVKELKFNLFSISQMCDNKNSVHFTDTECVVLSPDFKLLDESHVLLKVPRKDNMYSVDLKNIVPSGGLTCLFAKTILDEYNLWHRKLGHINFKTMNKLVRGNLVRGLPSKKFENDHSCVNIKPLVRPRL
ncbi:putative ribonuclease H-like domain-containing protein [Tanacetum coccineum]